MNEIGVLIVPLGFIFAAIIGFLAVKRHWKVVDWIQLQLGVGALSTNRVLMSVAFGILVVLVGSIIKRFDQSKIDIVFWTGIAFTFVVIVFIFVIVRNISEKTKEIKEL